MATDDKYDRQLRLWGAHGQRALMTSRICLLNAGPTGAETLKNLVLPGCGHFCIVDGALVTEVDCENNFFVSREHIGTPRAKVRGRHARRSASFPEIGIGPPLTEEHPRFRLNAALLLRCAHIFASRVALQAVQEMLLELNADVKGEHVFQTPSSVLVKDPDFFKSFSLVIATQLFAPELKLLASVLALHKVPLIVRRIATRNEKRCLLTTRSRRLCRARLR